MGLDIFFSKVNKRDYSLNKETAINNEIVIGYFCKVNCLLPFFGYENNQEYLEIKRSQIECLLKTVKDLLQIYNTLETSKIDSLWKQFAEIAQEELPTLKGFFFGSYEYDEWYVSDLQEIEKDFEKILEETDFDTEQVLMFCWW